MGVAIEQAGRDLGSAFAAVTEAEAAGADVAGLMVKLGGAGDFLSKAYVALRMGDYENANVLVIKCSRALDGVVGEAARLKVDAEASRGSSLFFAVCVSCAGLVLLFVFGLLGWRFLVKRYVGAVLGLKPMLEGAE
ncbi:MAG: hypothetical protein NWE95_07040 [Candidatus Bathyarchaeota archaeon]|nr:hypothetical protein [Candidatus Bathyarchaeota archaeon]